MRVRVYNDNTLPHREKYKGVDLEIMPGEFIEMARDEAVQFKSQFFPPKIKNGVHLPEGLKKLRLEPIVEEVKKEQPPEHKCMACGFTATSKAGLTSHIKHKHSEQMVDEDAKQELMGSE